MRHARLARWSLLLALGWAGTACSENTGPNADVVGTYDAIVLRLTVGSDVTDLLAAGADMSLQLTSEGTTNGALVIPGEFSESGEEETVPLGGAYVYDPKSETVTFDMAGDSFVRDVTWQVDGNKLRGTYNGSDFTLTAVLQIAPGVSES